MTQYDLGQVVGADGQDGVDGSAIWYTSTAPTYANSKYTFTISNLSGKTGFSIAVSDLIFYDTYYYIVSTVNSTTVDCATRVSIKGSDASVTVVDNLNSDSSTSVLSAKQGKVLNTNKIETSAIVTSFSSTTSDSKVPSEKLVKTELDKKIATSSTTGLVKNDGSIDTTSYSTFDGNYNNLTNKPTIPSASSTVPSADTISGSYGSGTSYARSNHSHPKSSLYAESSHTHTKSQITDFPSLSTVATSGSYSDLSNKPSIPSSSSDLSDGSDLVKKSSTSGLLKNDGSVDTTQYLSSLPTHNHDDRYYTESEVDTALNGKQATLVSGTNLKTINNTSLLGSGNIDISGGGGSGGSCVTDFYIDTTTDEWVIETSACSQGEVVTSWSSTLTDTKVPSEKLVKNYVDGLIGSAITYIVGSGS